MLKVSKRGMIPPFIVMDVMRTANERAAKGEDVIHLEVGQPSTPAPRRVLEAAKRALDTQVLGYTDALGIPPLREKIASYYKTRYGIAIDPGRIIVTTGSSGGFLLAFLSAFDVGDKVGLATPSYPAYKNILAALGFGAIFDGLGAVKAIEDLFTTQLGLSPWMILILMQLSFVIMGTFLDDTAMLVIVAPLYVPLVGALGFDLIWYGVLYTITTQIAYMTPPFGYNLFLMRAMAPPEITLRDIYGSILPFVCVMVLALAVVMAFPEIALWLPGYVYGN